MEWASVISDPEVRAMAAEAGELLLRKGITLPHLVERNNGYARKHGMNAAQYRSGRIEVNNNPALLKDVAKHGGFERLYKESVESGWSAQENFILHELGHYVDEVIRKDYKDRQVGSLFDRLDSGRVKELLSEYGSTSSEEFKAELISAVLKGKVFPKDFLAAADIERIAKGDKFNKPNALAESLLQMGSGEVPNTTALRQQFGDMMSALFHEDGAALKVEILKNPEMEKFIDLHARALDNSFAFTEMSSTMRERLQESDWMFSGMKTFHELNEAFPSLVDENGNRKPFERFLNDVQKIDSTYNRNWLNSEYNFAQASAEMAAKWERYAEDGDEYYLQYRTAGDDHVRPEHAELNGITLPASDSFWDTYYPPNGWNCRCNVVQVLRSRNTATDHEQAMDRGKNATARDEKGMFRFNPGKQQRTFPAYNPYTISRCVTCDKVKLNLNRIPDNQLCEACPLIKSMVRKEATTRLTSEDAERIRREANSWADKHLPEIDIDNGQKAKRLIIENGRDKLVVNKPFFKETFTKNIHNKELALTMLISTKIDEWLPAAQFVRKEAGKHHDFDFLVYEASYGDRQIECKVKDRNEKIVYTMRIKNKD